MGVHQPSPEKLRGAILETLYDLFPGSGNAERIAHGLQEGGYVLSEPEVIRELHVLQQGGYCVVEHLSSTRLGDTWDAKITNQGIYLIEGIIENDPGIEIQEKRTV